MSRGRATPCRPADGEVPAGRQWTWGGGAWAMIANAIVMGLAVALGLVLALAVLAF